MAPWVLLYLSTLLLLTVPALGICNTGDWVAEYGGERCWLLTDSIVVSCNSKFTGADCGMRLRSVRHLGSGAHSVKMKAAPGAGVTTNFYLASYGFSNDRTKPWCEVDFELMGMQSSPQGTRIWTNYFTGQGIEHVKEVIVPFDATADFHTYTIDTSNNMLKWFVDGVLYRSEDINYSPDLVKTINDWNFGAFLSVWGRSATEPTQSPTAFWDRMGVLNWNNNLFPVRAEFKSAWNPAPPTTLTSTSTSTVSTVTEVVTTSTLTATDTSTRSTTTRASTITTTEAMAMSNTTRSSTSGGKALLVEEPQMEAEAAEGDAAEVTNLTQSSAPSTSLATTVITTTGNATDAASTSTSTTRFTAKELTVAPAPKPEVPPTPASALSPATAHVASTSTAALSPQLQAQPADTPTTSLRVAPWTATLTVTTTSPAEEAAAAASSSSGSLVTDTQVDTEHPAAKSTLRLSAKQAPLSIPSPSGTAQWLWCAPALVGLAAGLAALVVRTSSRMRQPISSNFSAHPTCDANDPAQMIPLVQGALRHQFA